MLSLFIDGLNVFYCRNTLHMELRLMNSEPSSSLFLTTYTSITVVLCIGCGLYSWRVGQGKSHVVCQTISAVSRAGLER